jgi:hypothetical protein
MLIILDYPQRVICSGSKTVTDDSFKLLQMNISTYIHRLHITHEYIHRYMSINPNTYIPRILLLRNWTNIYEHQSNWLV